MLLRIICGGYPCSMHSSMNGVAAFFSRLSFLFVLFPVSISMRRNFPMSFAWCLSFGPHESYGTMILSFRFVPCLKCSSFLYLLTLFYNICSLHILLCNKNTCPALVSNKNIKGYALCRQPPLSRRGLSCGCFVVLAHLPCWVYWLLVVLSVLVFLWNVWKQVGFWRLVFIVLPITAVTLDTNFAILGVQNLSFGGLLPPF